MSTPALTSQLRASFHRALQLATLAIPLTTHATGISIKPRCHEHLRLMIPLAALPMVTSSLRTTPPSHPLSLAFFAVRCAPPFPPQLSFSTRHLPFCTHHDSGHRSRLHPWPASRGLAPTRSRVVTPTAANGGRRAARPRHPPPGRPGEGAGSPYGGSVCLGRWRQVHDGSQVGGNGGRRCMAVHEGSGFPIVGSGGKAKQRWRDVMPLRLPLHAWV